MERKNINRGFKKLRVWQDAVSLYILSCKIVRFSYRDYAEGGKTSFMTLKVHTFIGRLIRHIPDKHFPMIRYAGLFSNRWKEQYLSQARIALNQTDNDDAHNYTLPSWAERQTEYTDIDPLICPNCDQPLTYVGTFFGNWNELQYLFDTARKDSTIPWPRPDLEG